MTLFYSITSTGNTRIRNSDTLLYKKQTKVGTWKQYDTHVSPHRTSFGKLRWRKISGSHPFVLAKVLHFKVLQHLVPEANVTLSGKHESGLAWLTQKNPTSTIILVRGFISSFVDFLKLFTHLG